MEASVYTLHQDIASYSSLKNTEIKLNYREELILYFFNAMLDAIVDKWEIYETAGSCESINSDVPVIIKSNLPYKEVVEHGFVDEDEYVEQASIYTVTSLDSIFPRDRKFSRRHTTLKIRRLSKMVKLKKSKRGSQKLSESVKVTKVVPEEIDNLAWILDPFKESVRIYFNNGNFYEGSVFRKKLHGNGTFIWKDGTMYKGEFKQGEISGYGQMNFSNQNIYKGEFLNSYFHGKGTMYRANSPCMYHGEWSIGERQGNGRQIFEQNNWYDGEWYQNIMYGYGYRQYPSGTRYHGEYKAGKRHGNGCIVFRNNDFFTGEWSKGTRNGYGEYYWSAFFNKTLSCPIQSKYHGFWVNNFREGYGVLNFGVESGSLYAGFFEQNEKHGAGVVVCGNGDLIEADPIFVNDKPVHIKPSGSLDVSIASSSDSSIEEIPEEILEQQNKAKMVSIITEQFKLSVDRTWLRHSSVVNRSIAVHKFPARILEVPPELFSRYSKAYVDICSLTFPKQKEKYLSLNIPVHTSDEKINICPILMKLIYKYYNLDENSMFYSTFDKTSELQRFGSVCKMSLSEKSNFAADPNFGIFLKEERNLRKAISAYLSTLREIYYQYTTIACLKKVPFKTWMLRLFLWQFFIDCKLTSKGISLIHIDLILADVSILSYESNHNPFEIIYFWQFLYCLVYAAWYIYADEFFQCLTTENLVLKKSFTKLIEVDVLPNRGFHKGHMLFEYIDVMPFNVAYEWYKSFGEPHTAAKFVQNACNINKADSSFYKKKRKDVQLPFVQIGTNVMCIGERIMYIPEDEQDLLREGRTQTNISSKDHDMFLNKLHFLRSLGATRIAKILKKVCPGIASGKEIVNLQYPLTFLEFYESVLLCIQKMIDIEKEKIRAEKQRLINIEKERLKHQEDRFSIISKTRKQKG